MRNDIPHLLVVGTGAGGGIGRFERLLIATLTDLAEQETLSFASIWRRRHPSYLLWGRGGSDRRPVAQPIEASVPAFAIQIARAVRRERPELVLFLHVNLARVASVGRALGVRRFAIATYGAEVWTPLDPIRRHALHAASSVVSISEYTARQLVERQGLSGTRVHVVPLALESGWIDASAEPSGHALTGAPAREPGPRLLSVSRLEPSARDKGIDHVIQSLPEVRSALPDVHYHVVGDGPDRPYLERLAAECGVSDLVNFRGPLAHDDLTKEYRQADAFVLPSQREGFGLVFLEAMAYAKPVIARRAGATGEVVSDGRTGVLVDDEHALAGAIISLLSDPARARAMGGAGAERLRHSYSSETFRAGIARAVAAALA